MLLSCDGKSLIELQSKDYCDEYFHFDYFRLTYGNFFSPIVDTSLHIETDMEITIWSPKGASYLK